MLFVFLEKQDYVHHHHYTSVLTMKTYLFQILGHLDSGLWRNRKSLRWFPNRRLYYILSCIKCRLAEKRVRHQSGSQDRGEVPRPSSRPLSPHYATNKALDVISQVFFGSTTAQSTLLSNEEVTYFMSFFGCQATEMELVILRKSWSLT